MAPEPHGKHPTTPIEAPVIRTGPKRRTVGKQPPPRKNAFRWRLPTSVAGRGMLIVTALWIVDLVWCSVQSDLPAVLMFQIFAWYSLPHYCSVMILLLLFGIWRKMR